MAAKQKVQAARFHFTANESHPTNNSARLYIMRGEKTIRSIVIDLRYFSMTDLELARKHQALLVARLNGIFGQA